MANSVANFKPGQQVFHNRPIKRGTDSRPAVVVSVTGKKVKIDCNGERLTVSPASLS